MEEIHTYGHDGDDAAVGINQRVNGKIGGSYRPIQVGIGTNEQAAPDLMVVPLEITSDEIGE